MEPLPEIIESLAALTPGQVATLRWRYPRVYQEMLANPNVVARRVSTFGGDMYTTEPQGAVAAPQVPQAAAQASPAAEAYQGSGGENAPTPSPAMNIDPSGRSTAGWAGGLSGQKSPSTFENWFGNVVRGLIPGAGVISFLDRAIKGNQARQDKARVQQIEDRLNNRVGRTVRGGAYTITDERRTAGGALTGRVEATQTSEGENAPSPSSAAKGGRSGSGGTPSGGTGAKGYSGASRSDSGGGGLGSRGAGARGGRGGGPSGGSGAAGSSSGGDRGSAGRSGGPGPHR